MLTWLSANLINIALAGVIVLIAGLVICGMIRDKKAGKGSCGGSCSSCGGCSACGSRGTVPKETGSAPGRTFP